MKLQKQLLFINPFTADPITAFVASPVADFGTLSVCENTNDNTEYAICVNNNNNKISVRYRGYNSVILTT